MAFFRTANGTRCYTCFYVQNNRCFSGTFYILSDRSANFLSKIYKLSTILCSIILVLEIAFPLIIRNMNPEQQDIVFVCFFSIDALAIVPAAWVVLNKKKKSISREVLHICKYDSLYVYLTVALTPLNYTIMMIWLTIVEPEYFESFSLYLIFMTLLTLAALTFSGNRICQIFANT